LVITKPCLNWIVIVFILRVQQVPVDFKNYLRAFKLPGEAMLIRISGYD
jgi:hypothetical protein